MLSDNLKWDEHVDFIKKEETKRLYFLTCLKRAGVSQEDLTHYYKSIVRSVTEYACPVWHGSLTQGQTNLLEDIQKRAMYIIYPKSTYQEALSHAKLLSLHDNRTMLCKRLYEQIQNPTHKLNYLLPPPKENRYNLRHCTKYEYPQCNTERAKSSFISYCLFHFN